MRIFLDQVTNCCFSGRILIHEASQLSVPYVIINNLTNLKFSLSLPLTLILLMWRIRWAPNNASKWQMGFKAHMGSRTVAPLIPNLGTRWWWVVSLRHRPIYPRARPSTCWLGGWLGPGAGLDALVREKILFYGDSNLRTLIPHRRRCTLYRLHSADNKNVYRVVQKNVYTLYSSISLE